MDADWDIEARSRVKAYLRWKSIEVTDPALSQEGRQAVLISVCNDGLQALGEFVDTMAGHTVQMLGVICDGDPAEVTATIDGLIVSETQLLERNNPMTVQVPELTELLAGVAINGGTVDPKQVESIASVAAERAEIVRVANVIGGLASDGSQGVARRAAKRYISYWE